MIEWIKNAGGSLNYDTIKAKYKENCGQELSQPKVPALLIQRDVKRLFLAKRIAGDARSEKYGRCVSTL